MFRKMIFALAATVAIGAAALTPTTASAGGGGKGWHHHKGYWGHGFGFHGGPIYAGGYYGGCWVKKWVDTPFGPRLRRIYVCY